MLSTCPNWNCGFHISALERWAADWSWPALLCNVDGILWSYLRGILTTDMLKKQFKPGTIGTSEFMLGKDTLLAFQDACNPALVNTDDDNYVFWRILAHWDRLFFWWRTAIAGETFILWLNKNILNLFTCVWKKLIKSLRARFLEDDKHAAGFRILHKEYGLTWWALWLEINLKSKAVGHT